MNILDTVDHIAIQVKSIKEALKWYVVKFNCKIIYADQTWALIKFKNVKMR